MNYSTFAWCAAMQTQTSNVLDSLCLQSVDILRMTNRETIRFISRWLLLSSVQSLKLRSNIFELWVCNFKPLTFHIYLSTYNLCINVMCKQNKKICEETLACEDVENVERLKHRAEMSWTFWSCHKIIATSYCILDSECGPFRPLLAWEAVGWIFLQHQYLQCWQLIAAPVCLKRPWPAELWTLYPCPFQMDTCIVAPLECGVYLRHNWLCEWAILLFWEGLEYKKFCFKKWK